MNALATEMLMLLKAHSITNREKDKAVAALQKALAALEPLMIPPDRQIHIRTQSSDRIRAGKFLRPQAPLSPISPLYWVKCKPNSFRDLQEDNQSEGTLFEFCFKLADYTRQFQPEPTLESIKAADHEQGWQQAGLRHLTAILPFCETRFAFMCLGACNTKGEGQFLSARMRSNSIAPDYRGCYLEPKPLTCHFSASGKRAAMYRYRLLVRTVQTM